MGGDPPGEVFIVFSLFLSFFPFLQSLLLPTEDLQGYLSHSVLSVSSLTGASRLKLKHGQTWESLREYKALFRPGNQDLSGRNMPLIQKLCMIKKWCADHRMHFL